MLQKGLVFAFNSVMIVKSLWHMKQVVKFGFLVGFKMMVGGQSLVNATYHKRRCKYERNHNLHNQKMRQV